MYTSNYQNCHGLKSHELSISGDRGALVNYQGKCYPALAPKKEFWQIWHNNIGKISDQTNTYYYINNYYKEVLSKLDPESLYNELKNKVLLCYEKPDEFCHRHLVAAWLHLLLDVEVNEIKVEGDQVIIMKRNKKYDEMLENIIKENTKNMHRFHSLRAVYLFDQADKVEDTALSMFENDGMEDRNFNESMMYAASLRIEADDAEEKYMSKYPQHIKKLERR